MAVCRHCKKTVFWVVTALGTRIPLDPHPSAAGDFVPATDEYGRLARDVAGTVVVRRLSAAQCAAHRGRRWTSHLATCNRNPARLRSAR